MHLLLNVIVALILILTSARIMARVAVMLRFPSVIGEMVAGDSSGTHLLHVFLSRDQQIGI